MNQGIGSLLLRCCESILRKKNKTKMRIQICFDVSSQLGDINREKLEDLGYRIDIEEKWIEEKEHLNSDAYSNYKILTVYKNLL